MLTIPYISMYSYSRSILHRVACILPLESALVPFDPAEQNKYFQDAFDYLKDRYGEKTSWLLSHFHFKNP